jgi:hypothetical protein
VFSRCLSALKDERVAASKLLPKPKKRAFKGSKKKLIEQVRKAQGGDWNVVFVGGCRWFHSGGIFAALSDTTPRLIIEGVKVAGAVPRSTPTSVPSCGLASAARPRPRRCRARSSTTPTCDGRKPRRNRLDFRVDSERWL